MRQLWLAFALVLISSHALAQARRQELSPLGVKIQAALESEIRSEAERARDRNRMPIQTLEFFQMRDDMRVLELVPGGGWYTKVLTPVLRERGELYLAIGTQGVEENLLDRQGFERVRVLEVDAESSRVGRRIELGSFRLAVRDVDLALTFRNLHNFTETGRRHINQAVFAALRPGGLYGTVDHTRRHMQAENPENWRRMDPVRMIAEIQAVGFELVDFAELHYRPDDELRYEVGRRTVTGNTDRFTLLFRKPD